MRIVIAGAGEVGGHLAKLLSAEEQDIILVDEDAERLARMDANFNLMTVNGSPTSFAVLRQAHVDKADLFIAVMPSEDSNIVACSIAKNLGALYTVARINSYDFIDPVNAGHVRQIGVDRLIYPELLAAEEIVTALTHSWARHWFELHGGELILAGVRLEHGAPMEGVPLKDFAYSHHNFHVSAIKRHHETIIPRGDDIMRAGDTLYITTTRAHIHDLIELTGKTEHKIRRITVIGGGKITIRLLNLAAERFDITVIDSDLEACKRLPARGPECEIIHGDGRDAELLAETGIMEADAFVALTPSSETNILACMTAKELGVSKTIAEVENLQFISQAESLNIGTVINKKLLATSAIFQFLLDRDSSTDKCLAMSDAEVAEIEARPGSKITSAPVKDLKLSRNLTLAGLFRDGQGMLITGGTQIRPGDHVLVFCLAGALNKVEKMFV